MRYHFTETGSSYKQNMTNNNQFGGGCRETETLTDSYLKCKMIYPLLKPVW